MHDMLDDLGESGHNIEICRLIVTLAKIVKGTGTPQFAPTGSVQRARPRALLERWQMEGLGL
jgi:hypothetical protein